jgi:hypothetical protein
MLPPALLYKLPGTSVFPSAVSDAFSCTRSRGAIGHRGAVLIARTESRQEASWGNAGGPVATRWRRSRTGPTRRGRTRWSATNGRRHFSNTEAG